MVDSVNTATNNQSLIDKLNAKNGFADAETATTDASLNFETFLTLLTVQLQNQDPLNPMEGTEFTEQLATFSQLEQSIVTNEHLEALTGKQTYEIQALAVSYIGKDALVQGNSLIIPEGVVVDETSPMDFSYELPEDASDVTLVIVDKDGMVVRAASSDNMVAGIHEILWDGKNDDGEEVGPGHYRVFVDAVDYEGNPIEVDTMTYARVTTIEGDDENITVTLADGRIVTFEDIASVREHKDFILADDTTGDDTVDDSPSGGDDESGDDTTTEES